MDRHLVGLGFSWEANPPNGADTGVSDLAFAGGTLYAAFCCEPAVGSIAKIVDGDRQDFGSGVRVDVRGDLVVATRPDGRYTLEIGGDEVIRAETAHATDAAVLSEDQFVVLVNPAHFEHDERRAGGDADAVLRQGPERPGLPGMTERAEQPVPPVAGPAACCK